MLRVTRDIVIDEKNIDIVFVRASGPGGQNVNKLSTAAQLRLDTSRIGLAPDTLMRLTTLAGQRMTKDGVIVIHAQRFRTQERNRADAIDRLLELLREAQARVRRHLESPQFDEAEAAAGAVGRVKFVDAELGAVGVASDVDEEMAEEAVHEPGRDLAG